MPVLVHTLLCVTGAGFFVKVFLQQTDFVHGCKCSSFTCLQRC
jgi:hypothetical protein